MEGDVEAVDRRLKVGTWTGGSPSLANDDVSGAVVDHHIDILTLNLDNIDANTGTIIDERGILSIDILAGNRYRRRVVQNHDRHYKSFVEVKLLMISIQTVIGVLGAILLILAIIYVYVALNDRINQLIDDSAENYTCPCKKRDASSSGMSESYQTPVNMWNSAASYTGQPNLLLPTKDQVISTPALLPNENRSRGDQPMNSIAPTSAQANVPDANSVTGMRTSSSFPGPINTGRRLQYIEGNDKVLANSKVDDNAGSAVSLDNHVALVDTASDGESFSVNGRVNAAGAAKYIMPK